MQRGGVLNKLSMGREVKKRVDSRDLCKTTIDFLFKKIKDKSVNLSDLYLKEIQCTTTDQGNEGVKVQARTVTPPSRTILSSQEDIILASIVKLRWRRRWMEVLAP